MYMYVLLVVCHYYLAMEREKMTFSLFFLCPCRVTRWEIKNGSVLFWFRVTLTRNVRWGRMAAHGRAFVMTLTQQH